MTCWTPEIVDQAKLLWTEGKSAAEIAKILGGGNRGSGWPSRCAVLAKLNRSGLVGKDNTGTPRKRPANAIGLNGVKRPRPRVAPAPSPKPSPVKVWKGNVIQAAPDLAMPPERLEGPGLATLLTLGPFRCKWPIGDPGRDDFTFCGRGAAGTYCDGHARIAYQPAPGRPRSAHDLERSLKRYLA